MKLFTLLTLIVLSTSAFADLNVRVICGSGTSSSQSDALRKANDQLNRKLKVGVNKVSTVSDPKITNDHENSSTMNICVTVVAESFSDLAL